MMRRMYTTLCHHQNGALQGTKSYLIAHAAALRVKRKPFFMTNAWSTTSPYHFRPAWKHADTALNLTAESLSRQLAAFPRRE